MQIFSLQKIHPLEVQISGHMEALTITNAIVELAIKEQSSNSNYRDITVQLPVMKQPVSESENNASNLTSNELEDYLLNKIPFNIIT